MKANISRKIEQLIEYFLVSFGLFFQSDFIPHTSFELQQSYFSLPSPRIRVGTTIPSLRTLLTKVIQKWGKGAPEPHQSPKGIKRLLLQKTEMYKDILLVRKKVPRVRKVTGSLLQLYKG